MVYEVVEDEVVEDEVVEDEVVEDEVVDDEVVEDDAELDSEFTDDELVAVQKAAEKIGYNPNYDGPNKKTPLEFIIEGRNIQEQAARTIKDDRRHLEALRSDLKNVVQYVQTKAQQEHQTKITELESRVKALQAERLEAVEDADTERFETTEKALAEAADALAAEKSSATKADAAATAETPSTEFESLFNEWKGENTWYGQDEAMTRFATTFKDDPRVAKLNDAQYLNFVKAETEKAFPHKFKKAVTPASPVAPAGAVRRGGKLPKTPSNVEAGLSYQQRQILDEYERMIPDFNRAEYAKQMTQSG